MTSKCSICRLPAEKLAAIDAALLEKMPLTTISARTALSRSAIFRHSKHLAKVDGAEPAPGSAPQVQTPVPAPPRSARPSKTAVPATREQVLPAPGSSEPLDTEGKRARADSRLEHLWGESMSGLEASKVPVTLQKADGTTIEVHNLSARAQFIKAGQSIIDTQSKLHHLYDQAPRLGEAVYAWVIQMPKTDDIECPQRPDPQVIDVQPEPAGALTEGGTPDQEHAGEQSETSSNLLEEKR
jgi:hypothetical protein